MLSVAVNNNTSLSTKQWMKVFNSWCEIRRLQNTNIVTMAPNHLDNLLGKLYAEIKKQDDGDYEPESLRIIQCAFERHLKQNGFQVSILRDREFLNLQEVLNAKQFVFANNVRENVLIKHNRYPQMKCDRCGKKVSLATLIHEFLRTRTFITYPSNLVYAAAKNSMSHMSITSLIANKKTGVRLLSFVKVQQKLEVLVLV